MVKSSVIAAALVAAASAFGAAPKYVFLFIGDGMSVPQRMTANEFSIKTGNGPLEMNSLPVSGLARSCSADSLITDSAAAATAIACGRKTNNHYSGVDPEGKPLESCAVVAQKAGRKIGIMTSVTITHATPAGFYAHRMSRGDTYGISTDLADSGFDFFAGGGLGGKDDGSPSNRYAYAESKGYRLVRTPAEFAALKPGCGKILTKFTNDALETAIDWDESLSQPKLDEIVAKAVEVLDGDNGFFIMCEGGRIDWAGHGNDAATNLRDVIALNDAVRVALAFQERHPEDTLIIVTGDHETGGMTMGFGGTGYNLYPENLASQTMSVNKFNNEVKKIYREKSAKVEFSDVKPLIAKAFGFKYEGDDKDMMVLRKKELKTLEDAFDHDVNLLKAGVKETEDYMAKLRYTLGNECRTILSHKCGLDWTSGSHTAMPVLTTAKGPEAARFSGFYENTEIGNRIKAMYAAEMK